MSRLALFAALLAVSCSQDEWTGHCDAHYEWRRDRVRDLPQGSEIQLRLEDFAWNIQDELAHGWIHDIEALQVTVTPHRRLHTVVAEGTSAFCPDVEVVPAVASISAVGLPLQLEHDATADRAWRRGRTGPWNRMDVSTLTRSAERTDLVLYALPDAPDGMPEFVVDSVRVTTTAGWSEPVLELTVDLDSDRQWLGLMAISVQDNGGILGEALAWADIGHIEGWPPSP